MAVLVTQFDPKWDFSDLNQYGDVKFLTDKEYKPEPTSADYNKMIHRDVVRNMNDYVAGEDYIVMTGSAIPNFLTGMRVAQIAGRHKILKWSNRSRDYQLFIVNN